MWGWLTQEGWIQNVFVKWIAILIHFSEILYTRDQLWCPIFLAVFVILSRKVPHIKQKLLPYTIFPIHYSLTILSFDII
jgi:hypothetical protein